MRWVKIIERILATIPIMLGVSLIVFLFMRLTPGDPIDLMMGSDGNVSEAEILKLQEQFSLNKPLYMQLIDYYANLFQADLGRSITMSEPVLSLILKTLPATIELALMAALFSIIIGIPVGVYSAVKQNSLIDRISMGGSFLAYLCLPFG